MTQPKHTLEVVMEAVERLGSNCAAARELGVNESNVRRRVARAKKEAPQEDLTTPNVHDDVSSLVDMRTGETILQWVKRKGDKKGKEEALQGFMEGLLADIPRAAPKAVKKIKGKRDDIMPSILIGDAHIGAKAYAAETKHSDVSTSSTVQTIMDAVDYLVDIAEPAVTGMLVDVGDLHHANGSSSTTKKGTPVDTDVPYSMALRYSGATIRYSIDKMLTKFDNVVVVIAMGNHNTDAAPAVQQIIEAYFHLEPRVTVLRTDGHKHYIEYGKWLIGVAHGENESPASLGTSMARDMAPAWGRTTHRVWFTGHLHQKAVTPLPGVQHIVCPSLIPPDSWHASKGYAGDGEMTLMTLRRKGGVHSTHVFSVPQPMYEPDFTVI